MKTHPFFEGIDFTEISKPDYKGLLPIIQKILPELEEVKKDIDKRISVMNVGALDLNQLGIENIVVLKGQLCKRNWYGNKQIRFFELYKTGELKYYKDMKEYKGSIMLRADSKITKVAKTTIKVYCVKKEKEYMLIQPDSSQISFAEEQKKGYVSFIDKWVEEMNNVVDYLKSKGGDSNSL